MDTKWNSTGKDAGEELEYFVAAQVRETVDAPAEDGSGVVQTDRNSGKRRWIAAIAAFLAFFFGLSLLLGSLGAAIGRLAWKRGITDWQETDWQETAAFRAEVASYLKEFLTLGAGEDLVWYDGYDPAFAEETSVVLSDWNTATLSVGTPVSEDVWEYRKQNPDYTYKNDKNVLYKVYRYNQPIYRNVAAVELFNSYENLPEGYNFFLSFKNGKVSIWKDGQELDVYGDGMYDDASQWFVPGYENFPAGDNVNNVTVYMAVREEPVRYYFSQSEGNQISRMYYVYQSRQESVTFWLRQAILCGVGVLLLAVWFVLRKRRYWVDEKFASWTRYVWTEIRFAAVVIFLCVLLLPQAGSVANELWWEIRYEGLLNTYVWPTVLRALAACLENTGALLGLVWTVWLIHNDHRYTPKAERRSLLKLLLRGLKKLYRVVRTRDLKRPIQKRLARNNTVLLVVLTIGFVVSLPFLWQAIKLTWYNSRFWNLWEWAIFLLAYLLEALLVLSIVYTWHSRRFAKDIGLLADQVEAIRGGDLSTPLELPEDADLRQTAEALNDIQAGLHKALADQTRSERMKVELISNVSHDLKTPLTSILSYAELLRQEPLEGAAADYARIIDEKAQRLKAMVQDVFEVSKAASDQLPVTLERLDLAKLLRQTLADMDAPIQKSGLTFKVDLPDTAVDIVADGKRLYRVFQNLIDNALKYALPGSRVYLSLKTQGDRAEASLRNTSRDELPEGVDFTARFVRGDESRTDGGSGLGLSIASSFTEACGGQFRVETLADLFTAVVTFPLAGECSK